MMMVVVLLVMIVVVVVVMMMIVVVMMLILVVVMMMLNITRTTSTTATNIKALQFFFELRVAWIMLFLITLAHALKQVCGLGFVGYDFGIGG